MGCKWYLAMTAAELAGYTGADSVGWMACHFSTAGGGLSNLPRQLPADSLVILDDSTPFDCHDPDKITRQLCQIPSMSGLLLDFQRPGQQELYPLIHTLRQGLSCPVAVTEAYAKGTDCPVFLSTPLNVPLSDAVAPWQGRALWLDIPFGAQRFIISKAGCRTEPIAPAPEAPFPHWDEKTQCSYQIETAPECVCFTLQRRAHEAQAILALAEALGIEKAVSLRQEYIANP